MSGKRYKTPNKKNILPGLRDLVSLWKSDGYIDEDTRMFIFYPDGTSLVYPDDIEEIKLRNIVNIIFYGSDDGPCDFWHDFIGPQEEYDEDAKRYDPNYFQRTSPLIIEDIDEYFKYLDDHNGVGY